MDLYQRMGIDWRELAGDVVECRVDRVANYAKDALSDESANYRIVQRAIQDYLLQQVLLTL
jgi:hypothetical protein